MREILKAEILSESDGRILDQFELGYQRGFQSIEQFLELLGYEIPLLLLVEIAFLDMEFRYKAGDFVQVEEYFLRFPQLAGSPDLMVSLITEEFRLKQAQMGPKIEDYLRRFPRLRIALLAAMHDLDSQVNLSRPDSAPSSQTLCFGHYQIIEQVGQGSFATVYKAKDQLLGRIVAVKQLRVDGERSLTLGDILNEAKNSAVLTHPNIAQVFEVTVTDNHDCLIVSQFIDGLNLAEVIQQSVISCKEAAGWVLAIAEALHSAHILGILHLDIKPSNILLDRQRKVWLCDFGLSRCQPELQASATEAAPIGTLAYMSPEQARVKNEPIDERSDIYCLGVVLFELLTGRLPFQGNHLSLMEQLRSADPPSPREFRKEIHRDLDQICLKALAGCPAQRYRTARDMADDLQRYLDGKPTQARPLSQTAKAARWCWRNPQLTSLAMLVIVVCAAGAVGIAVQWQRALQQEQIAENGAASLFNALATVVQISSDNALRDPDSRDRMQAMLIVAKENYEQALKSNTVIKSKPHQTAKALLGLGTVFNQLGDYDRAVQVFDEAALCLPNLVPTEDCKSLATEITLGKATSYRRSGDKQQALPLYYRVLGEVMNDTSSGINCRKRTAEVAWYIAEAELSRRNLETAAAMASLALNQWSDCRSEHFQQGDTECLTGQAKSTYLMATCDFEVGNYSQALEGFRRAGNDFERLSVQFPAALNYRRDLAASYHNQARSLQRLGNNPASQQLYLRAIEIRKKLVDSDPENFSYLSELSGSQANLLVVQRSL